MIEIIEFQNEYKSFFEAFNKAWIEEYYTIEPTDKNVLENPEEAILKNGGRILFAKHQDKIIGTVALKKMDNGIFELTKMAVDKNARGIGAGKLLCKSAIEEAKKMNAQTVILYSNTRQSVAINIYRQMGFTELPVEKGAYERADIKMELSLTGIPTKSEIQRLIDSYGQAHEKVMTCLKNIPEEIWDWQPPYNKWTIRQNIIHLADSEANAYVRCRRFIAEPGSGVFGYDQNTWANELNYNKQSSADALELFRLLRKMSFELIKELPIELWQNTIEHSENGTMKFWQWLKVYENHTHVFQMQRVFEAWKKEH